VPPSRQSLPSERPGSAAIPLPAWIGRPNDSAASYAAPRASP
jgi:hypothetical protein